MTLAKLNAGLTLLANMGVLAGILFIVIEIRQNTAAVNSATIQAITNASAEGLREYASDKNLAQLRLNGESDPTSLSELESFQYLAHNRAYWLNFQNVYLQYQLGVLGPELWSTYSRVICIDIGKPGIRATWADHSVVLDPPFVAVVEACADF